MEKDSWVLVGEKLNFSLQCVLAARKARHILGYIKISMARKVREATFPLCSDPTYTQLWGPPAQQGHGPVVIGPEETTGTIRKGCLLGRKTE